jgi:hypothetical protein
MTKINNTSIFTVNSNPADNDLLLGTDVSNTSNDPDGETVNFRVDSIAGGWKLLQVVEDPGDTEMLFDAFDNTKFSNYMLDLEDIGLSSGTIETLGVRLSTDNGSTFYDGASDYQYGVDHASLSGQSMIRIATNAGTTTLDGGRLYLYDCSTTSTKTLFTGNLWRKSGTPSFSDIRGYLNADVDVDALQVTTVSGNPNILGIGRLYGLKKA